MRDSQVQFLGAVPTEWGVQPAVTLARVLTSTVDKKTYEGEKPVRLCNYTDVYYGSQIVDSADFAAATASPEQIAKFSLRAGDVPFTKDSETADDIGVPAYVPNDIPGAVYGYHLSIFRPHDTRRGRFMRYVLESDYAKAYFEAKTPGVTRVGLSQATIRYFRMPAPPIEEAVAIADYLDRETAQIDAFIAKNEELIALLTERRARAVSDAVLRGLDADAQLLDSGVPWLGQVPKHWSISRLSRWFDVTLGKMLDEAKFAGSAGEVLPYLRASNIKPGQLELSHVKSMPFSVAEQLKFSLRAGDLVVVEGGSIGVNAPIDQDMPGWGFQKTVNRIRSVRGDLTRFLGYQLDVLREIGVLGMIANVSTIQHLTAEKLERLVVAVPPVNEQIAIVDHIAHVTSVIDDATKSAEGAIKLARERRAALISAAVTGTIDVGVAS